jgi:hypothetical protein
MTDITAFLRSHFLLRWILANMIGWSLGLYLGGALLNVFGGIFGAIGGGALAGGLVGLLQWLALRLALEGFDTRWVLWSALGGALALVPAFLAGAAMVAGPQIGYFAVGAVYGLIFGALQGLMLRGKDAELAGWWIAVNLLAGGLCGCLTMTASLPGLPLFCSPGPAVFGLLTGVVMRTKGRDFDGH